MTIYKKNTGTEFHKVMFFSLINFIFIFRKVFFTYRIIYCSGINVEMYVENPSSSYKSQTIALEIKKNKILSKVVKNPHHTYLEFIANRICEYACKIENNESEETMAKEMIRASIILDYIEKYFVLEDSSVSLQTDCKILEIINQALSLKTIQQHKSLVFSRVLLILEYYEIIILSSENVKNAKDNLNFLKELVYTLSNLINKFQKLPAIDYTLKTKLKETLIKIKRKLDDHYISSPISEILALRNFYDDTINVKLIAAISLDINEYYWQLMKSPILLNTKDLDTISIQLQLDNVLLGIFINYRLIFVNMINEIISSYRKVTEKYEACLGMY